jgi:hypothetical protein
MGILARVKNRLMGKKPATGIGPAFARSSEEDWNELVEQVDNYTQKTGAAIVQTWEVGAAELGRAVHGKPDAKQLIERYSDALVPTLTPFQDLHKKASGVMKVGFDRGASTGQLSEATHALLALVEGLDGGAESGWTKTVEYLEPVLQACKSPEAARAALLAHGAGIRAACDSARTVLADELARGAARPTLWAAVTEPFDRWQLKLVRELEITLTEATRELVRNVRA